MKKLLLAITFTTVQLSALLAGTVIYVDETNTINNVKVISHYTYDLSYDPPCGATILRARDIISEKYTIPNILQVGNQAFVVTNIADSAFADNIGLLEVEVPNTILSIGAYAFANCTALAEISIGYGIRYIGERAFVNTIITKIPIPDSLLDMGGNISAGTLFTSAITISDSSHFTYSDDGVLYNKDMTKLYACPTRAEGTITIPSTVTNICQDAFFGCFRLSYLNIPENVNTIGNDAFNVYGIWPGLSAPESTPKLQSIFYNGPVPSAADDIYEHAPADLVTYAFTDDWPSTWKNRPVTVIGEANPPVLSFRDNDGITWYYRIVNGEATICNEDANGNAIAAISPTSTSGARYYESEDSVNYRVALRIPNSINGFAVTKIGDHAFDGCKAVTAIGISPSIQEIGAHAFSGCTALRAIDGNDNVPFWAADGKIALPTGIAKIGYHAFEGMTTHSLSIPYTVNSIDGNPLAGMEFVTTVAVDAANPKFHSSGNIVYNKGKTSVIGVPANYDGSSIAFLASVTDIGEEALYGCANLNTITLPAALETISSNAFAGCAGVYALTIPSTVSAMEAAFDGCTSLTKVSYGGNAPAAPDNLYAGTPETLTSFANEDAGFTAETWKDRPIVLKSSADGGDDELSYDNGIATWYYRVVDGTAEIWRSGGRTAIVSDDPIMNLTLPDTLGGYIVKGIGDGALANLRGITSMSIPNTYEWIGDYAFSNCTSLASVNLGNGVTKIGRWPFYGTKISMLAIPDSVSEINGNPVAGCPLMQEISVASSHPCFATEDGLLYDKRMLTLIACPAAKERISLPETLEETREDAFYGCHLLESGGGSAIVDGVEWEFNLNDDGSVCITSAHGGSGTVVVPEKLAGRSVADIADGTFAGCSNVTEFVSHSPAFRARNGVLYSADGTRLVCVPDTLVLPHTIVTSNIAMRVVDRIDAVATGELPYIVLSSVTNSPVTKVSTETVKGDISLDSLLYGVTSISGYAFKGINIYPISVTTNRTSSGRAAPGDGSADAKLTSDITIVSVSRSTQIEVDTARVTVASDAFADSGVTCKETSAQEDSPVAVLRHTLILPDAPSGAASTYSGYVTDADGTPRGTLLLKVAKAKNGVSKVTAEMQLAGQKKKTVKGSLNIADGTVSGLDLSVGENGMAGSYGGYRIEGARNLFASKRQDEVAAASRALATCPDVLNVAWNDGFLSMKITKKGKVSVSGTLSDGSKVSAKSQLTVGDEWLCIPVSFTKKPLALTVWIPREGGEVQVYGPANAVAGAPGQLNDGAKLRFDWETAGQMVSTAFSTGASQTVDVATEDLPDGVTLVGNRSTWTAPGDISNLKLRYAAKTGTFKGSFKAYRILGGKRKATTVKIAGAMIDGSGYGFATIKKAGSIQVEIR